MAYHQGCSYTSWTTEILSAHNALHHEVCTRRLERRDTDPVHRSSAGSNARIQGVTEYTAFQRRDGVTIHLTRYVPATSNNGVLIQLTGEVVHLQQAWVSSLFQRWPEPQNPQKNFAWTSVEPTTSDQILVSLTLNEMSKRPRQKTACFPLGRNLPPTSTPPNLCG